MNDKEQPQKKPGRGILIVKRGGRPPKGQSPKFDPVLHPPNLKKLKKKKERTISFFDEEGIFHMLTIPDKIDLFEPIWRDLLFQVLIDNAGHLHRTCATFGIPSTTLYKFFQKEPWFEKEFRAVQEQALDLLEDEARRRAVYGVERGIYYKGRKVATEREYSDKCLQMMLSAYRSRFKNTVAVEGGKDPVKIIVEYVESKNDGDGNPLE